MHSSRELLTKEELCALLNIEPAIISEYMNTPGFPYFTRGKEVYFLRDDVERWMQYRESAISDSDAIPTEQLLVKLREAKNFDSFMQIYQRYVKRKAFHDYLADLLIKRNMKKAEVIKRANLNESYVYQIFRGERSPSRETDISLAFGFELNADETQKLLKAADERVLSPKIPREAVIYHCIERGKTLCETQIMLKELSMTLIGGDKDE